MNFLILLIFAALLSACSSQAPQARTSAKPAEPERPAASTTFWSAKTELYLEYPALVQGEESRFALHFTRLADFQAMPAGKCDVRLIYTDGASESFSSPAPSKAGIFGVTVKPTHTGDASIEIRLSAPGLSDMHRLEHVTVFRSDADVSLAEEKPKEETLPFLKEQQWALDFATQLAQPHTLRESLFVPAEVTPRSGGETVVTAPLAGRLVADKLPVLGTRVDQGQVLASVLPPTSTPSDRATLDLAKAEADATLDYAKRDRERAARLAEAGAAPAKRLDEARTAERTAEARLHAAEERLRQFDASRTAEGTAGSAAFAVRAPIGGVIVEVMASPGANLKGGEALFRIVDTDRVYISAIVPEADYPKIRNLAGAEMEIPGIEKPRALGRLVSVGKVVDPVTRTFGVTYEAVNGDARIAINQTVNARLFLSGATQGTTVPETAIVDDAGRPVVFVQLQGEKFARRPVQLGRRQDGLVEIVSGVRAGERVVTKGAYLIRLSALSSAIPAHGHVH